ncbi:hypothetical protein [Desulfohalobium retbaense]|uniref:Uncharacterized protein n=1 Tax=Desulfohalobium retbaense (strain ATCC 49708 / DSM 5692 / JCM 16813 / HR100) TaxID=485915 RepID=C8X2D6_DESRD|nr:hypothetical protein [Desulfohalobium retbaense]ACV68583.1 conserved hypothetical protein [Desulfohalobium retbaense DSM 5692]
MSTIMPESKRVRDALAWILDGMRDGKDQSTLLAEACLRFNLSPKDEAVLRQALERQSEE